MSSIKDTLLVLVLIALHYVERINADTNLREGISAGKTFRATQEEAEFLIAAGAARMAEAEHNAGKASAGHKAHQRQINQNADLTPKKDANGEGDDNDEEEEEEEEGPADAATLDMPALKERATVLKLEFASNISKAKLLALVQEAEAKAKAAADEDSLL